MSFGNAPRQIAAAKFRTHLLLSRLLLLVLEFHQVGAEAFADFTASRESHPALKTLRFSVVIPSIARRMLRYKRVEKIRALDRKFLAFALLVPLPEIGLHLLILDKKIFRSLASRLPGSKGDIEQKTFQRATRPTERRAESGLTDLGKRNFLFQSKAPDRFPRVRAFPCAFRIPDILRPGSIVGISGNTTFPLTPLF